MYTSSSMRYGPAGGPQTEQGLPKPKLKDGEVSMGTTIMCVSYKGGVILGADSRTTTGNYIANRVTDKITPLSDNVYILRSGSAADTQAIAQYVQLFSAQHQAEANQQITVKTSAFLAAQLSYQNKDNMQAGMIVSGFDNLEGGVIYAIPLGGTVIKVPYAIGGSGSAYIYGFCDKYWKPDMPEAEAKEFIVRALTHAMFRDASSGGCVRTVTIDKDGARRDFIPSDKLPVVFGEMAPPAATPAPAGQVVV